MAGRFSAHLTDYQHIFRNKTKRFFDKAVIYGKGVLMSNLRNIERISEGTDADYFKMQHFITESKWDHRELIDQAPTKLKATIPGLSVTAYMNTLTPNQWNKLTVRNTARGKLTGYYHFAKVFIWDKSTDRIQQRMLVIRKTFSRKQDVEIKFSFTNVNLEQYTPEVLAYMQAQRFFVEHCFKESKQILGLDQFQARKWQAWQHQVVMNFLVSSFILK